MPENNNQDLTKVYELIQKENRWNRVTNLAQTALMLIPTFILIYKSFQKQRLSPKQRLMRNRAAQARLKLDEELILKEALHESELKSMETGLDSVNKEENETSAKQNKSDLLTSMKQKSENFLKDKIGQVKDKADQFKDKIKVNQDFKWTKKDDKKDQE